MNNTYRNAFGSSNQFRGTSRKEFPILSLYRTRVDLLILLICNAILLLIIPINFEIILHGLFDLRNILYILMIFISLISITEIVSQINRNAKIVWFLLLMYFTLEFSLYWYHHDEFKNMFYAVWMLLLIGFIFYAGGSINRLILLLKTVAVCIAISTFFGLLIVYVGEPFLSIREFLIGIAGDELTSSMNEYGTIRVEHVSRLVGFSKTIFAFSYLLVILSISSFCLFQYTNTKKGKAFWGIVFLISILGIFSNAERSALIAVFLGILFLLSKTIINKQKKIISLSILVLVFLVSYFVLMPMQEEKYALIDRVKSMEKVETKARMYIQIAGLETIIRNPLGVRDYQDYFYIALSYQEIRAHFKHEVTAPHNHLVNVGFHSGWMGLVLAITIFVYLIKCGDIFKNNIKDDNKLMWIYYGIVVAFIANFINSLFHNTGLFFAEPGGLLMTALIGAGASICSKNKS